MIFLDSAATSFRKPPSVMAGMNHALRHLASPGRGGYRAAMEAADAVLACREKAACLFHAQRPEQVVFTSSATQALNTAVFSLVRPGARVLVSGYEHNSVMRPLHALGAEMQIIRSPLFHPEEFLKNFRAAAQQGAGCAVLTMVSNVFGYVLPAEALAEVCREYQIPLIWDASQAAGHMDVHMDRLGAEYIAMPGHKGLMGPQGTGILLCAGEAGKPLLYGGTGSASALREMPDFYPDRLEAGTHNVPGICGLAAGLDFVQRKTTAAIGAYERRLTDRMIRGLTEIPGITVYADPALRCQTGVVSFTLADVSSEEVGEALGRRGIAVRAGLHCAPEAHRSAGTLETGTVRASVSAMTAKEEIDLFLNCLESTAAGLRRRRG